jgi:GH24 family phage-related lysozyme (muramidase)
MADLKKTYQENVGKEDTTSSNPTSNKIDVRTLFNQSGLLVKLFPELKIKKEKTSSKISELSKFMSSADGQSGLNVQILKEISVTSRLSAKNSTVLPGLAYNIDMIRKIASKILTSMGESLPSKKASIFFKGEDEREAALESAMKKDGVSKVTKMISAVGGKEKPGESKEGIGLTDIAAGAFAGELASKMVASLFKEMTLKKILLRILTVLATPAILTAGVGLLALFLWNTFKKKQKEDEDWLDEIAKKGGLAGVKDEAEKRKSLPPVERAYQEIKDKERFTEDGVVNDAILKQYEEMGKTQPEYAEAAKRYREEKGVTPSIQTPTPTVPTPTPTPAAETPFPITTPTPAPAPQPTTPTQAVSTGNVSEDLVNFLKQKENPKLAKNKGESKAQWDFKQWSIGYGTKASGPNEVITEAEADKRLRAELSKSQNFVIDYGKRKGYNWNQGQTDALTSFVYNLGPGQLDKLTAGGKRTNEEIAQKIKSYNKVTKNGKLVELAGLTKRRSMELSMFNAPVTTPANSTMASTGVPSSPTTSTPSVSTPTPSSGPMLGTTSAAVADARMASMTPQPISNVIDNSRVTNYASASPTDSRSTSVYDEDLIKTLTSFA